MMTKSKSSTPTMRLCRFIGLDAPPCYGPYRWMLETDGRIFVVCDSHLAEGIRRSGLPAYISSKPPEDTVSSAVMQVQSLITGTI